MNEEILVKIYKYCAYQDRCRKEIVEKLSDLEINEVEILENYLLHLSKERFWDEERFARNFARGKFRIKGWGRLKIRNELRLKEVSQELISLALKEEIEDEEYLKTLRKFVKRKAQEIKDINLWSERAKIRRFLAQKGYEDNLIIQEIEELLR